MTCTQHTTRLLSLGRLLQQHLEVHVSLLALSSKEPTSQGAGTTYCNDAVNGGGLSSYNSSSSCEWREGSADDHQEVDLTGPGFGLGLDLSPSPPVHLKSHNPPPSPAISLTTPQGRHGMLWPMGILLSTCNCNGEELNDSSHSQEDSYAPVTRSTYYQSTTLPTILLLRIARQHNWNLGDYAKTEIWLVNEIYSAGEVPS